jgi:type VI protein secretion system component VasK
LALVIILAFADVASLKTEPDPNRRSELALTYADEKIDEARQAYQAGNDHAEASAIQELMDSVTLCYASLEESHGSPRKSKYYKHAELKVSALMRRLAGLRDEVSLEFRPPVEAALKKVSDVHDQLIDDIMSRKKQ